MPELATAAVDFGKRTGTDPYFLRLPLDEPYFEIDANTRTISVPSELRQIGVKGDKYAEVVFFRIDRYFDAVDLATRNIYIEWEAPDGNGGTRKGFSRDYLKDTQSEKDKIIFGWLIDGRLTKGPGNIQFSVRFVEWDEDTERQEGTNIGEGIDYSFSGGTILYSFSTLPATITVTDSLNYTLFENDTDYVVDGEEAPTVESTRQIGDLIFSLSASDLDSDGSFTPEYASEPEFVRDLANTANLTGPMNDQPLQLEVEAISNEAGVITYAFGYKQFENQSFGNAGRVTIDFIKVTEAIDDGREYYMFNENNHDILELVTYATAVEALEAGKEVRERVAHINVNQPGYYTARAYNRVTGKRVRTVYSNTLHIPAAEAPTVTPIVTPGHAAELGYEPFVIDEVVYHEIPYAAGNYSDVYFEVIDAEDKADHKNVALTASGNHLSYKWFRSDNADMSDAVEVGNEVHYNITTPGYYSAVVRNDMNNSHAETGFDVIGKYRVTNMPEKPVISNWSEFESLLPTGQIEKLRIAKPAAFDKVSFEWRFVSRLNPTDKDKMPEGAFGADVTGEFTAEDFGENDFVEIEFLPRNGGKYFPIISTTLNGATSVLNTAQEENYGVIEVELVNNPTENVEPESEENSGE